MAEVVFPNVFYNALEGKVIPALNLITDFFSDEEGVMKKYRNLQNKNLTISEEIYTRNTLEHFIHKAFTPTECPSLYVNNGYMTTNSPDRFVFLPMIDDSLIHFDIPHVTKLNGSNSEIKNINSFIINSRTNISDTKEILKICYTVADKYFTNMMMNDDCVPNTISRYYKMYCHPIENLVSKGTLNITNISFAVDRIITCIKLLDTVFNLKFRDMEEVKSVICEVYNDDSYKDSFESILDGFDLIYNYAIDKEADEYDYIVIFAKILKF